jgi:hypothetical protein
MATDAPSTDASLEAIVNEQTAAVLDLDELVSAARRPRRTVIVDLRPDLEQQFDEACRELAKLVNIDGTPLDEPALGDTRIADLRAKAMHLDGERQKYKRRVVVQAMTSDDWETFEDTHRDENGDAKNTRDYTNRLLVACAVEPKLTMADVAKLRKSLSGAPFTHLVKETMDVNTKDGLDVPKSPSYLVNPEPSESSLS